MIAKTLKHKERPDTYGDFMPWGKGQTIGNTGLPRLFPPTATIEEMRNYFKSDLEYWEKALEQLDRYDMVEVEIKEPVTGEKVGELLSNIHTHAELLLHPSAMDALGGQTADLFRNGPDEIVYREKDLLPTLVALGLPEPVWGGTREQQEEKP